MLEGQIEGRLTQTIWSDGKRSHSVSRLNQVFMFIITLWWITIMAFASCESIRIAIGKLQPLPPFVLLATLLAIFWWTRQDFAGQIYRKSKCLEDKPFGAWAWRRLGMPRDSSKVILRDTKAKDAEPPT